jgi:hypothetical protein
MAGGLLIVESRPASHEKAAKYHDWYDNKHVPEILQLEGFVSTRRLEPVGGGAFITVYEIEGDVEAAKAALQRAQS